MAMADYAKIAGEAKAKQDAVRLAATEKLRQDEATSDFFKGIEAGLGNEIRKANPELLKHGLLTGHKAGGIAMPQQRFATQIRLSYGHTTFCEVNLDQTKSMVQVEMNGESDGRGLAVPEKLAFRIVCGDSGAKARKVESDEESSGEFGPGEIAEIVIIGLIRGHFE